MKPALLPFFVLVAALSPLYVAAADCRAIVDNTLAELKAAYPDWDDNMENLVRTAAGSACVKASSAAPAAAAAPQMREQAVRADADVTPAAVSQSSTAMAAGAGSSSADGSEAASAADDDDDWTPFKGIKFNKVSASPNRKPYERRRDVNKAAPKEDSEEDSE